MASLWKTLTDSAREAASSYRKLADLHRQEVSAAGKVLQEEHRKHTADLQGALRSAALYEDTDEMHAAMEEGLRDQLLEACGRLDSPRARRVLARLEAARVGTGPPLALLVLDSPSVQAFVGFGETIYVSAGLLSMLVDDDDALAFVLAHEATHIDAGHNRLAATLRADIPVLPAMAPLQVGLGLLTRTWMSPHRELEADRGALALVQQAGFSASGFEAAFDALAALATEQDMAEHVERDLSPWAEFWQQKLTGYPSIRDRQARLRAALQG